MQNADIYVGYTLYFSLSKDLIKTMKKDVFNFYLYDKIN